MTSRTYVLRQLVERSLYTIDERQVAEAMVLRAHVRRTIPDVSLGPASSTDASFGRERADATRVRSFRPDTRARSFRLARSRGSQHA